MGGKDDDRGNDLDKWIEAQRAEIVKLRDELLGQRDNLEKDLRSWTEDASSSSVKGPFERFKNFVDSNFTTLSEGLRNFPSNIAELKDRMQQEREARRLEEREIWRRWTGSDDSPDHIRMQIERATSNEREASRDAAFQLLKQAFEKNKNVPPHKILELYRDNEWKFGGLDRFANPMLSFGGACYYKPETVENLPSTARWGWPAAAPQWLSVDWFKRSPYSPIRLEMYPGLEDEGSKWRAAFEDLLSAALDKPMISEEKVGVRVPYGKPQSTYYGPGLEWMMSLQCRGLLPPQLPSLYKPVSLFDGFDEVKRPRSAPFMHDIAQILESKSATMYPLVKRDLEALIDEVSIKSGPESEAAPLPYAVAPLRVPATEQDLYEQMPPLTEPDYPAFDDYFEVHEALSNAVARPDVSTTARLLSGYFGDKKVDDRRDELVELIKDVLDDLSAETEWRNHRFILEALRQSDIPRREQEEIREELDSWAEKAYDRYMMDDYQLRPREEPKKQPQQEDLPKHEIAKATARSEILAQLTTTQTTRLPDGTVTTKVVLKQRFADGTEEEHETVHTSRDPQATPDEKKAQEKKQVSKERKKNGGWFWS